MKLIRNEIGALLNYYQSLEFDLEDQMNTIQDNCQGIIDSDLYGMQLNRYDAKRKEIKDRVAELTAELDKL